MEQSWVETVAQALNRGMPRRGLLRLAGGGGIAAAGAGLARHAAPAAAQDELPATLEELLELPGVVLAFEWDADGTLGEYRSEIDVPAEVLQQAARYAVFANTLVPPLAHTFAEFSNLELEPVRWIAYAGGDYTMVAGATRGVLVVTADAGFPPVFRAAAVATLGGGSSPPPTEEAEEDETGEDVAVAISGFAFDPAALEVAAGTTVTWTNEDDAPHTVTADNGAFDSGQLNKGDSWSWTFENPGTVAYHCAIHPRMTATVTVS